MLPSLVYTAYRSIVAGAKDCLYAREEPPLFPSFRSKHQRMSSEPCSLTSRRPRRDVGTTSRPQVAPSTRDGPCCHLSRWPRLSPSSLPRPTLPQLLSRAGQSAGQPMYYVHSLPNRQYRDSRTNSEPVLLLRCCSLLSAICYLLSAIDRGPWTVDRGPYAL